MAGMKRFIAYIYGYENAKKAGNTGFARIELRGEECRLEIHLRSVYAAQTHCRVYLFRKQGNQMEGSLIGEMDVRNGAGDFATAMKTMHIPTSSLSFFEMDGIFLCSEDGRIFMSRWTEGEPLTVDMLNKVNTSITSATGNIVYLDKSQKHMYELNNKIRLINVNDFLIDNCDEFLGFICGVISQDHDLEEMYLDSFLTIASIDSDELLNHAIQKLDVISEKYNVKFILSVSKDESKLTDIAKAKIVISL